MKFKVTVRINGLLVDTVLCPTKYEAIEAVNTIVRRGLEVYGIHKRNIKSFSISILKNKEGKSK